MSNNLSEQIERINKTLQDKKVEKNSYERQKDDLEKEYDDMTKKCREEFGLEPEQLKNEIDTLEQSMQKILNELKEKLNE